MNEKNIMLKTVHEHYDKKRLQEVDEDFLSFEEELITEQDLHIVIAAIKQNIIFKENPHNSIILYVSGVTNQFDFTQARSDTRGGTPPDIDVDFEALNKYKAIDWIINEWGKENVASIMTQGTFKPKSLTHRFFKITEGPEAMMREILKKIPPPVFGKEATLEKILEVAPELRQPRYREWLNFTQKLEGMTQLFGIHPAGIIISDFPISNVIPCWKNSEKDLITQYDMHESEELGLIKFDLLIINNLDILKETCRLIKERHGIDYNIYNIPDGNLKAYELIASGFLTGIFQMEASAGIKELATKIRPQNWNELSDLLAMYRPGPIGAGVLDEYIENKNNGYPPIDMPEPIAEVLSSTYWTLVYQEQVNNIAVLDRNI